MAHEGYKVIAHGPSLERLMAAMRWYKDLPKGARANAEHPPIVVRFSGDEAFDCFITGLRWVIELHSNEIWVEAVIGKDDQSPRWSGVYNFRTHKGRLTTGLELYSRLDTFLSDDEVEQLSGLRTTKIDGQNRAALDVEVIADLIEYTELQVCEEILMWFNRRCGSEGQKLHQNRESAVAAFGRLRATLAERDFYFAGERCSLNKLEQALGGMQ